MGAGPAFDIGAAVETYRAERGRYESFTSRIDSLITNLLEREGIEIIQVESRTKDLDSFQKKLKRKGHRYTDPLRDITDISGIRVITYYLEDVDTIGSLIRREFTVDDANSVDKSTELAPDRFGYLSVHYVVSLNADRSRLPEWQPYAAMKAEIQVRTALQHAWAAVNHKVDYKAAEQAPPQIQRQLYRLSALFELADEQLSHIRATRSKITDEYKSDIKQHNFDIPLNTASLATYFAVHPRQIDLMGGMKARNPYICGIDEPHRNRGQDLHRLVAFLILLGITSVGEFDGLLQELSSRIDRWENSVLKSGWYVATGTIEDELTLWVMIDRRVDLDLFKLAYAEDMWGDFQKLIELYHS